MSYEVQLRGIVLLSRDRRSLEKSHSHSQVEERSGNRSQLASYKSQLAWCRRRRPSQEEPRSDLTLNSYLQEGLPAPKEAERRWIKSVSNSYRVAITPLPNGTDPTAIIHRGKSTLA